MSSEKGQNHMNAQEHQLYYYYNQNKEIKGSRQHLKPSWLPFGVSNDHKNYSKQIFVPESSLQKEITEFIDRRNGYLEALKVI